MPIACDICGGPLVMVAGGKGAVCKNCGMEHSVERVREMLGAAQGGTSPAAPPAAKPKNGTPKQSNPQGAKVKPNKPQGAKAKPNESQGAKTKPNESQGAKPKPNKPQKAKPKPEPYLELRNVCKTVDGVRVLRNVNLQVGRGEKVFLGGHWEEEMLLCRMVAGLETMTSGEIYLDGVCLNNLEPKDRQIGIGSLTVYPHMTVYETLAFVLKMKIQDEAQIDQRVRWTAEQLDLTDWLQQQATKLPAEQKIRCSIGRSLSTERKMLFLWDPFQSLEKEESLRLCADLERLLPHFGAVVVVVKDLKQAEYWSGSRKVTLPSSCLGGIGLGLPAGSPSQEEEEILDAQWIPL